MSFGFIYHAFDHSAMRISGHKTAAMLWRYNIVDERDIKEAGRKTEAYLQQNNLQPTEISAECVSVKPS